MTWQRFGGRDDDVRSTPLTRLHVVRGQLLDGEDLGEDHNGGRGTRSGRWSEVDTHFFHVASMQRDLPFDACI